MIDRSMCTLWRTDRRYTWVSGDDSVTTRAGVSNERGTIDSSFNAIQFLKRGSCAMEVTACSVISVIIGSCAVRLSTKRLYENETRARNRCREEKPERDICARIVPTRSGRRERCDLIGFSRAASRLHKTIGMFAETSRSTLARRIDAGGREANV